MYQILAKSPIFIGVATDEIKNILSSINYQLRNYNSEQIVALSEEECDYLLIVIEGSVRGEMIDFSGKIIKIEDIEAPRPIAPAFLFGKNNKYPVNIIANTKVKILFLHRDAFVCLMQSNSIILNNYLCVISNRTQFLSNKIKFLSFKTIKGKIVQYILEHVKENSSIKLQKSQQELADFFGVTRPALARAIGQLKKDGLIDVKRREIQINDKKSLVDITR